MTRGMDLLGLVERDTFGLAVGTAIVAGALSVVLAFLTALVGTLAALALAGWAMMRSQESTARRAFFADGRAGCLMALGAGVIAFAYPPTELAPYRGLVLALTLLPLWWSERRRVRTTPIRAGDR